MKPKISEESSQRSENQPLNIKKNEEKIKINIGGINNKYNNDYNDERFPKEELIDTTTKNYKKNSSSMSRNQDEDLNYYSSNSNNYKNSNNFLKITKNTLISEMVPKNTEIKTSKFNGITIVQNLRDYFPEYMTLDQVKELVFSAFNGNIVESEKDFIRGKNVTTEQALAIVDFVFRVIRNDRKVDDERNNPILNNLGVHIEMVDLNKDIVREKMFKGQNPNDLQLENAMKNLSGGKDNVKVLSIFFE